MIGRHTKFRRVGSSGGNFGGFFSAIRHYGPNTKPGGIPITARAKKKKARKNKLTNTASDTGGFKNWDKVSK